MAISPKFIAELAKPEVIVVAEETTLGDAVQHMIDAGFDERRAFLVVRPASGNEFRACVFGQLNQQIVQWLGAASLETPLNQLPIPSPARVLAIDTPDETSGGAKNWLQQHPNAILIVYDATGTVYLFCNVNMSGGDVGGTSLSQLQGEMKNLAKEELAKVIVKHPAKLCPYCKQGIGQYDKSSNKMICNNATCARVLA